MAQSRLLSDTFDGIAFDIPRTAAPELYRLSPDTLSMLQAIRDLAARLVQANDIAVRTNPKSAQMKRLRAERDYAIRLLYDRYKWVPYHIDTMLLGRDNNQVTTRALHYGENLPFGERPEGLPAGEETQEWAIELLKSAHGRFDELTRAGRTARAVRQDLIRAMCASGWRVRDLAELTGLTTSAIGQIRTGTPHGTRTRTPTAPGFQREKARMLRNAVLGHGRTDRPYPQPLDDLLARWHGYTDNWGHSIVTAIAVLCRAGSLPRDFLIPVPVRTVLRVGWQEAGGYVVCDLPYDTEVGFVPDPEDEEF